MTADELLNGLDAGQHATLVCLTERFVDPEFALPNGTAGRVARDLERDQGAAERDFAHLLDAGVFKVDDVGRTKWTALGREAGRIARSRQAAATVATLSLDQRDMLAVLLQQNPSAPFTHTASAKCGAELVWDIARTSRAWDDLIRLRLLVPNGAGHYWFGADQGAVAMAASESRERARARAAGWREWKVPSVVAFAAAVLSALLTLLLTWLTAPNPPAAAVDGGKALPAPAAVVRASDQFTIHPTPPSTVPSPVATRPVTVGQR